MATKRKTGRPTDYLPEYNRQVELAARAGFIDTDLAELLGVSEATLNNWKKEHPEFLESIKRGKDVADDKVEKALYDRALGYSHPDVHISNYKGDVTETEITKHYPPDPVSMIFWLKNRRKDRWRDKQEIEHSGNVTVIIED